MGDLRSLHNHSHLSCDISILTADRNGENLTLILSNEGDLPTPFTATNRPITLEEVFYDQRQIQDCPS